jgi:NAD+ synthase (glutamine-hydrolysing)
MDPSGAVVARGRQFQEDLVVADIDVTAATRRRLHDPRWRQRLQAANDHVDLISLPRPAATASRRRREPPAALLEPEAEVYQALVLGTGDYFRKNGFSKAVLGLSGGIDSALALVVAADALGPDSVTAVSMPSRFTADINREDGAELATRLGVRLIETPIRDLVTAYDGALASCFADTEPNVAEENLQARIRGNIIMALSNKFGWLVLTTGNKSEMSVGYATLYGDMAGGFSILKDVLKTWVYRVSRWVNRDGEVIPQRIIDKPPSAELREDQLDTDSLPPYNVLDGILEAYVEHDRTPSEIEALGFDGPLVTRVVGMVDRAEYKRRQAPPGVRISTRAFGKDRRLPITNHYRPE